MAEAAAPAPNYIDTLQQALTARKDWLERSELAKLKEDLRIFQISFSVLYNLFIKKKLINEDPYKGEAKISELEVPETGPFIEAKRMEQVSLRLANYDNQLDFLVNFCQFGVDFLNLERIRRILGLVRFIDWVNLTPDSQSVNTKFVAETVNTAKSKADPLNLSIIGESLTKLPKCTAAVLKTLRDLATYHKENYKLKVRTAIGGTAVGGMSASEANAANIKKKLGTAMPGTPFIQEYVDELIKEDYSKDGPSLRESVLKALQVAEDKPKVVKQKVSYKDLLLDGIQAIGSAATAMGECALKTDENQMVLENRKKSFWEKVKQVFRAMLKSDPEELIYELVFIDREKGTSARENLNFHQFRADLDRKIKILTGMSARGPVMAKLTAMNEEQITGYLERTIRDVQNIFKILTSLDDYFKGTAPREDRGKIKGIKPELASIKNCIVRANQLRYEYLAAKEEEEQMKRLGINPGT